MRGKTDELKFYDSMNYMYDPEVGSTRILKEIDENRDIIANYSRNLAWIEKNIEKNSISKIYENELCDTEEFNQKLARAFQTLYKAADGHQITEKEAEIFHEVNMSVYFVFGDIYEYFKTGNDKILRKLEKQKSWLPSHREDMLFQTAIQKLS